MRVLLAGHLLGQGGIQSHLRWLARAAGESGIEVLGLSVSAKQPTPEDWQCLQQFKGDNVKFAFCTLAKAPGGDTSAIRRLSEIIQIIQEFSPDIYLAVGTGWNLFLPPLLARSQAVKVFHEVMSGTCANWFDSRWLARWCFDQVVAQSPTVAETFAHSFGWNQPIIALPALPEPLEVTACLPEVVPKSVKFGQAKAALFSRLVPHKQAFWLVQQWESLEAVLGELHIHGSGPEERLIQDYIAAHGWGDRIKCFGRYPEGQAYVDLLSQYDLTLLPTIGAEGAPLVLLESMACGVPFVAYGVGGIPDYGVNNPDVLVVAPERWVTDQAKTYATVESSPANSENLTAPKSVAFIAGIKQMALQLAEGQIDQARLQQFYREHYSYAVLKKVWVSYFSNLCK